MQQLVLWHEVLVILGKTKFLFLVLLFEFFICWPKNLKGSYTVLIYKSDDKLTCTNYRPISLISNIVKIFERVIYDRLYDFVLTHGVLSKKQFGFLKDKITRDALEYFTSFLQRGANKNKKLIATFIVLKKAFDTVEILMSKWEHYGISEATPTS